jgi:hypothetical protein
MTDMKAINPAAIETYAGQINSGVDTIVQGLNDLCANITNVNYGGRNAYAFKSDSSRVANSLSTKVHEALTQLARQVAQATSDLSGSLGGSGIVINLKDNKFTPASPGENSDRGVASMSGLKTLASQVETAFTTIATGIAKVADMPPNSPAGWMGDRRNLAEGHINEFVGMAKGSCTTTQDSLTKYIQSQMSSLDGQ